MNSPFSIKTPINLNSHSLAVSQWLHSVLESMDAPPWPGPIAF
jgi:hypothetical protein